MDKEILQLEAEINHNLRLLAEHPYDSTKDVFTRIENHITKLEHESIERISDGQESIYV